MWTAHVHETSVHTMSASTWLTSHHLTAEQYEDRVFSAGGDIRDIVIYDEYDERRDSSGMLVRENEFERFGLIPGAYDEVPVRTDGMGDCGHPTPTGAAYVSGTGWCCNDCESPALDALHAANTAAVATLPPADDERITPSESQVA
jgi:hypothetical protein